MSGEAIEYKSGTHQVNIYTTVLEISVNKWMTCAWGGTMDKCAVMHFKWKFDWDKLKNQGIDKFTGHITVSNLFNTMKIDVKLTEHNLVFIAQFECHNNYNNVSYEYSLTPHYAPILEKLDYDKMFAPSDQNDTILVVDGQKLHVNKTFLSYHSEYFRALFSSKGQVNEIPIDGVFFEDFALLLSTFYPNPVFPNDSTVETLLEMASCFEVSSVINIIEYHLMNNSKINSEKMLWMADEYVMPKLLENCIRELNTVEKARKLKQSDEYENLSDGTKAKVLDRIMDFI
ncbi:hypothetical protein GCK72_004104 [Caenorhabditis remanei]|uniref:BTB domain-containing protein n=1 Tax=Caenorhabditis remanei TaxID=31234 RepID=A0A6A5HAH3_CAERE|nr:hypothetical protein GCK72_004104 [Caenorhabditis remanei]KAF1764157.1 hypothetical protein GCK72_004104 [Caenorhabditis remanei]